MQHQRLVAAEQARGVDARAERARRTSRPRRRSRDFSWRELYFPRCQRIELMTWEQARAQAAPIRLAMFVRGAERSVRAGDWTSWTRSASTRVAFEDERAVGTGRLLPDGHIGRMAVLKEFGGKGVGGAVLAKLMGARQVARRPRSPAVRAGARGAVLPGVRLRGDSARSTRKPASCTRTCAARSRTRSRSVSRSAPSGRTRAPRSCKRSLLFEPEAPSNSASRTGVHDLRFGQQGKQRLDGGRSAAAKRSFGQSTSAASSRVLPKP